MRLRLGVFALAAMVIVGTTACNDDKSPDDTSGTSGVETTDTASSAPSSSSSVSTTTAVDPATDKTAVENAYQRADKARRDALLALDLEFPALLETHVDPALNAIQSAIGGWQLHGQALRFPDPPRSGSTVQSVELSPAQPGQAVVAVCRVDDSFIVDSATGEVVVAPKGGAATSERTVHMQFADGVWKVSSEEVGQTWEGVGGCAA